MQSVDDVFGGNTDCRDEQLSTALNNNSNQLVKLSLGVIVAVTECQRANSNQGESSTHVTRT